MKLSDLLKEPLRRIEARLTAIEEKLASLEQPKKGAKQFWPCREEVIELDEGPFAGYGLAYESEPPLLAHSKGCKWFYYVPQTPKPTGNDFRAAIGKNPKEIVYRVKGRLYTLDEITESYGT